MLEEPGFVLHRGEQLGSDVGTDRLEPTLRIAETNTEGKPQQPVVAARDQLALEAAPDSSLGVQPGADRHVAVTRQ